MDGRLWLTVAPLRLVYKEEVATADRLLAGRSAGALEQAASHDAQRDRLPEADLGRSKQERQKSRREHVVDKQHQRPRHQQRQRDEDEDANNSDQACNDLHDCFLSADSMSASCQYSDDRCLFLNV